MKLFHVLLIFVLTTLPFAPGPYAEVAKQIDSEESLQTLFPDGLEDRDGNKVSVETLDGKVVGMYFSAHWCPPCRLFTPKLVAYRNANKGDFEVVFLSSDRSKDAKLKYMKEANMDWYTVDYDGDVKEVLSDKWAVRGIPTLVLWKDGKTLTRDGRSLIEKDTDIDILKTARMEIEEFKCDQCDKVHTREKLVWAE